MKKILLIVNSSTFSCELKLSEKSAERLVRKIIKRHRYNATHYLWTNWKGNVYALKYRIPNPEESIIVEFKHI